MVGGKREDRHGRGVKCGRKGDVGGGEERNRPFMGALFEFYELIQRLLFHTLALFLV